MFRSCLVAACLLCATTAGAIESPPSFLLAWGDDAPGDGGFYYPQGVAVGPTGTVYVVDTNHQRVQYFTSAGGYLGQWGTSGSANGQFTLPIAIAIDADGKVYVADAVNNTIQKFSSTGEFVSSWGGTGIGPGQFKNVHGLAVDPLGYLYVADTANNRVQKMTLDGGFLLQWSTAGAESFGAPYGIAVGPDQSVYVGANAGSAAIYKFTDSGSLVTSWSGAGIPPGPLGQTSIAVDAQGRVCLTEYSWDRVEAFTSNGEPVTQWGTTGAGSAQFNRPAGVAIDSGGNVYVVDSHNDRVQMFGPLPTAVRRTSWGYLKGLYH